jgi:hypothetical protein
VTISRPKKGYPIYNFAKRVYKNANKPLHYRSVYFLPIVQIIIPEIKLTLKINYILNLGCLPPRNKFLFLAEKYTGGKIKEE